MKYCRFRFEEHIVYGSVEERRGELWIVDLIAHRKKILRGISLTSTRLQARSTLSQCPSTQPNSCRL
jgi:hypothetical protein